MRICGSWTLVVTVFLTSGFLVGCSSSGTDGADGNSCSVTDNDDGTHTIACSDGTSVAFSDGNDGPGSLVSVTDEAAGVNCADGGKKIESGVDDNADGVLDAAEREGAPTRVVRI